MPTQHLTFNPLARSQMSRLRSQAASQSTSGLESSSKASASRLLIDAMLARVELASSRSISSDEVIALLPFLLAAVPVRLTAEPACFVLLMISDEPINRAFLAADWASSYLYAPVISSPRHLRSPPNTRCGKLCGKPVENRVLKSQIRAFRKHLQREEAREITLLVRLTDKQVGWFGLVLRTKPALSFIFLLFTFMLWLAFASWLTKAKTKGLLAGLQYICLHLPTCDFFR